MKKNKIKVLSFGIVFFICLSNITNFLPIENFNQSLKISAGEINIVTPENKTYYAPMSGYYPATFGFENDEDGSFPMGWIDDSVGPSSDVTVESEKVGHKKVLYYNDPSVTPGTNAGSIVNLSTTQTSGSIEYYVYKEAGNGGFEVSLRNSTDDYALRIGIDYLNDGKFIWRTNSTTASEFGTGKYSDNTWFHIRIDFDILSKKFDIYLDGVKEVDQENMFYDIDSVQSVWFHQTGGTLTSYWYLDALSFSWDSKYNIGDNVYEGLLLSFENSTPFVWTGYSLDNQANKTIIGNTTIPIPEYGFYSIQIFGYDSIGGIHESELRYFAVYDIIINTPVNKTYGAPMSGYYPATFGFENDEDGSFPMEWIDDSVGPSSDVTVESEKVGHKKVLYYNDPSMTLGTNAGSIVNLSTTQTSGSIEYYVYKEAGNGGFEVSLRNSTDDYALRIGIDYLNDGKFIWRTNSTTASEFGTGKYSDNTWFHIRIDFDILSKKFDIYLDGIKEVDQENIFYDIDAVQNVWLHQTGGTLTSYWYLDALSFSWDSKYNIGDNLIEGLLLSFENSTQLDWIGYSLDSQVNKTILGNSTFPMPNTGLHSIQIFGNDSIGTIYRSGVRYFSVDTSPPQISITSPDQNDFFGALAPSFEISVVEPNLNTTWYTLDNGVINKTFTGLNGIINQIEWDKIVADSVTIRFYANDSFGYEGNSEVVIKKDLNHPLSLISQEGLTFTITADDGSGSGVSVIKYKINGSSWIDYTVPFSLEYGIWNITYQAIDAVGNVESEHTLIINLRDPGPEEEPGGIPSYPLFSTSIFLLGTIMAIIYFLRKKHFKYRK